MSDSQLHPYHKIQSVYLRDPATKHKTFLDGQWTMPEFGYLSESKWICTEKIDGTNVRLFIGDGWPVHYHGRTDRASLPAPLIPALNEARDRLSKLLSGRFVCYGEGYGAKIQKGGGNYREDQGFVLFDILAMGVNGPVWMERENVAGIAKSAGVEIAPEWARCTLLQAIDQVSHGISSTYGDFRSEGLVCTPATPLLTRGGSRIITKIKCKDFDAVGVKP